jgi:hypothetical protein
LRMAFSCLLGGLAGGCRGQCHSLRMAFSCLLGGVADVVVAGSVPFVAHDALQSVDAGA